MKMITSTELKSRLSKEKILVIDVREEWEYDEENIGAKNIPLATLPKKLKDLEEFKSSEIVVHCKSGNRSKQAQKYLTKQGFANVKSLEGGLEAYLNG